DGDTVIPWDRSRVPVDRYAPMEAFLAEARADAVVHVALASTPTGREGETWLVNYEWPSEIAWITRGLGVRFVYASTALVFTDGAPGPRTKDSVPDAPPESGYGYEKRRAEERVLAQNPAAIVARLGWQIGGPPGSNNMIAHLDRMANEAGRVRASTRWFPACSFVD